MKIALVHDHLTQDGGAERVLRVLSSIYKDAPIYTLAYNKDAFQPALKGKIITSFLERPPFSFFKFEWLLPLMPAATEHYNLKEYDIILSSCSAMAKGAIPGTNAQHICYLHTPTRYLWTDTHEYLHNLKLPKIIKAILPHYFSYLRQWDKNAADRTNVIIANSNTVKDRTKTFYKKDAIVVYPPVDTHKMSITSTPKTYFLAGGRIVSYKKFDLLVTAFNRLGLELRIYGSGPFKEELEQKAKSNIKFLGRISDEEKIKQYQDCIAFLNPQEEDFGITVVEAMACGRPVIAFNKDGATETIIEGKTGTLFNNQRWEDIADTVLKFDETKFNPEEIKQHAEKFSKINFENQIKQIVNQVYENSNRYKEPKL